ncbi:DUF4825 domain-containing protein [Clostridium vincentii]|uniref:DUF4825 domain-containing protein n=1 Tax=Clostridium vincentii TaxID=52704 RepID=A0A2T0BKK1_9CLOT|nr:DUF4825 domain-containing protein [Clostridium vincentii]PRR84363.1 hypothetical protein CLVI_02890 [Clostridium vincentii]
MKIRNKIILCLAIIGIVLYAIVQGVVIPEDNHKKAEYIENQKNPITHDLDSIMKYKSKYMGDNSNITNLFYNLPLNNISNTFELFPDKLTVEVNYKESVENIDKDELENSLIYNTIASFALIDNLEKINYNFTNSTYKFLRSDIEKMVGEDLSGLLTRDKWKIKVQDRIENGEYMI